MSKRILCGALGGSLVVVLFLAGWLALPQPVRAQSANLRFFHLTTADGLSHDIVYAIAQDAQGFLWFGTQDGLNRYDGYTFTVFRHLRSEPSSLAHSTVQALLVDSSGALWVGTVGGLDRYDRDNGRFVHYDTIAESVTVIYEDRDGQLWVGTAGAGLFCYNRSTDAFAPLAQALPDTHILAIYQDEGGTLWVGTEYGGLVDVSHARPYNLPTKRVTALIQDSAGQLWAGSGTLHEPQGGGLLSLAAATGQFVIYSQGLHHTHVTALLEDDAGTMWVGTEQGLATFDAATGSFTLQRHDPLDTYSLLNDYVHALYEDKTGILWIATDGGVSRYVREKNRFGLYRSNPQDANSLAAPRVGALLVTRRIREDLCAPACPPWLSADTLWVGLHNAGLDRIDLASGRVSHYRHDPNDPHSLSHDHVTALFQDDGGAIWIGTDAGLDRLTPSPANETGLEPYFTHYAHDPANPHSLGPGAVKVIYQDHAGTLWIGTEDPGTLSRLDAPPGELTPLAAFTVYRYDADNPGCFPNTYGIRAILEDSAGYLWLGTYSGLVRFDPRHETFTQYRHDPSDPYSLSDDFVWSLYEAPDGTLWVGTHGGLNRLDKAADQFAIYTIENGLPNDGIAAILPDDAGYLWLATMGGGLSRFDPRTATFRNYDTSDGLQGLHFIPGAAYRSPDGELFFGGSNGINHFYPADIHDNPHAPPIVLTAFRKFDRRVDFGRDLADVRQITLSYRDNFFSFEFAALDYTLPNLNRYAYILEGFDPDWVYCGTRHYAAYTNVPPGRYTFRVKGSNNDGIWNEAGLALQVMIAPPFWATGWFKGLVGAVVISLGAVIYTVRARNIAALRQREERFRALFENAPLGVFEIDLSTLPPRILRANQAAARIYGRTTLELEQIPLEQVLTDGEPSATQWLVDKLRMGQTATLEAIHRRQDGSEFPVRISAALQRGWRHGQLAILIVEDITTEKALRSEAEAIAEERRRIAHEIHDGLAQDLAALRLQVHHWQTLVDSDPARLRAELNNLHELLGKKISEVRRAIFALRPVALEELGFWAALRCFLNEFGEQNQLYVNLEVSGVESNLPAPLEAACFRIIQEALYNVAKHAQARLVWVDLSLTEGLRLRVRDDGVGFDPATLPTLARQGHVGLQHMRERVHALGGTLTIFSQPGQGTEISVVFPTPAGRDQLAPGCSSE